MKLSVIKYFLPLFTAILLIQSQCSNSPVEVSGGASGTDISSCTIKGTVIDPDWCTDEHAQIHIRPYFYLMSNRTPNSGPGGRRPGEMADMPSHRNGDFVVDSMKPGIYMIEITKCGLGYAGLCTLTVNDTVKLLDSCVLKPLSVIKGMVTNVNVSGSCFVEVFGLDKTVKVNDTGYFQITVPAGDYHLRFYSEQPGAIDFVKQVQVSSGMIEDLGIIDVLKERDGPRPPRPIQ